MNYDLLTKEYLLTAKGLNPNANNQTESDKLFGAEDAYVMVDPFSAQERRFGTNFLQLGGNCAHCKISVCVECSIFYSR